MKKIFPFIFLFLFLFITPRAFAAIAYDANGAYLGISSSASQSYAFTVGSNTNRILYVGVGQNANSEQVSAITYNGVAMTRLGGAAQSTLSAFMWCLVAPATGSNNIVLTAAGGTNYRVFASSYSGVNQSCTPDALVTDTTSTAGSGIATYTTNITTVADQDWLIEAASLNGAWQGSGGNSTSLGMNGESIFYHRGPVTPAGATTISTDTQFSGGAPIASVTVAFKPVQAVVTTQIRRVFYFGKSFSFNFSKKFNFFFNK